MLWISEIQSLTPKCLRCLLKEPLSAHLIKMNFQAKQVTRRYAFIASVLVIAGLAVLGRASYIMVVKKDFWMAVNDRFTKENDTSHSGRDRPEEGGRCAQLGGRRDGTPLQAVRRSSGAQSGRL